VRHAICGAIVLARTGLRVWFKCLLVLLLGVSSCFAQKGAPKNIVSLSLCTDQLLLMLVPRQHIASVTRGAIDPHLSYMAAAADGLVLNSGGIEEVLPLKPDLIVGSAFASRDAVRFLRYLGYPVKLIGLPQSIAEIREMVLNFGSWVGYPSRAKQLVKKWMGNWRILISNIKGLKEQRSFILQMVIRWVLVPLKIQYLKQRDLIIWLLKWGLWGLSKLRWSAWLLRNRIFCLLKIMSITLIH